MELADCPWQPDNEVFMEDCHNYKGWYNILYLAVVNNFYMFVDAKLGRPGGMADSTVTQNSYFYAGMTEDQKGWLGEEGVLVNDEACGISRFIMVPYTGTNLTTIKWFNFCFSSIIMFVEQVFGMTSLIYMAIFCARCQLFLLHNNNNKIFMCRNTYFSAEILVR